MPEFSKKNALAALGLIVAVRLSYPILKNLYYLYFRPNYWSHLKSARRIRQEIRLRASVPETSVVYFPFEAKAEISETGAPDEQNRVTVGLLKTMDAKIKASKKTNDPFLPPFDTGIFIMNLNKTHCLIFNKFQVTKNHLLIITRIFEAQTDPLTETDLFETYNVMRIHSGFAFFNSDEKAGASQRHKHLQVIPYSQFKTPYLSKILEIVDDAEKNAIEIDHKNNLTFLFFPFFRAWKHSLVRFREFNPYLESPEDYKKYLHLVFTKSRHQAGIDHPNASFNLIMGKNWMLIVPRKAEKFAGSTSMNSLAFVGSLVTGSAQKFEAMQRAKPSDIFNDVMVAKDDDNEYSMIKD